MGVHEGRGTLEKSMKNLLLTWQQTRMSWDDEVAKAFESNRLTPLEADMKAATTAMDARTILLRQVRRECE